MSEGSRRTAGQEGGIPSGRDLALEAGRHDIMSRDDVVLLVDAFYDLVLADDVLGYIFNDVAHLDVEAHLPVMYRFWETLLLGARSYSGNPMQKHVELNRMTPLLPEHFHRWVSLFAAVVNERFEGENATVAIATAESIARSMQMRMSRESDPRTAA